MKLAAATDVLGVRPAARPRTLKTLAATIAATIAAFALLLTVAGDSRATVGVDPSLTIDSQNPLPAVVVSGRKWFSSDTITFGITVNANGEPGPVNITCHLDEDPPDACPAMVQQTPTTYVFTFAALADGVHDMTVEVTDSEGDSQNVTVLLGIDTQNPLVTFERPFGPVVRTTLNAFDSEFSVFDGISGSSPTADCRLDGGAWAPCDQKYAHPLYGLYKHPISGLTAGMHTFQVRASDVVNRVTTASLTIHVQAPGTGVEVSMSSSTTFSAAHPDLRIEIDNNTSHDLMAFTYKLPDGLFGSLAGVPGEVGDGSRCPYPYLPDFFTGCDQTIKDDTRVGNVQAVVDIGGQNVTLDGAVHLVDPYLAGEPAALVFSIEAKLGALDFGTIVVPARVIIQPTELDPMVYEDLVRSPTSLNTIVDAVPTEIEDPEHGTLDFTIKNLTIDIEGEVEGGPQPFLTNPSSCDPGMAIASVITDDNDTHLSQPEYTVTGCDKVAFAPTIDQIDLTSNNLNDLVGMTMNVHLPDRHSTIEGVQVDLPRSLSANTAAYGIMCLPDQAMRLDPEDELNGGCPESTQVGTATIDTPLLTAPITGTVYLEDSGGTLPFLYINVRDSSLGVNARLRASNDIVPGGPNGHIRTTLDVQSDSGPRPIASVPVTDFTIDLPGTHQGPGGSLTPLFRIGTTCNPVDHAFARFSSHAQPGVDLHETISPALSFTGCTDNTQINDHGSAYTPPAGGTTSNTSAAFRLDWAGGGTTTFRCSLDGANYDTNCGIGSGVTTGFKTYTGLSDGVHKLVVSAGGSPDQDVYTWKVDTSAARDETPPSAPAITSGPADGSTTADRTPTWQFTASDAGTPAGSLKFECRLNDEAFIACGTGSPGQFTAPELPAAAALFDGSHSFSVRVADDSGNTSSPATIDFTVGGLLSPFLDGSVSDDSAGGHPEVTMTVGNESNEDIRDLTLSLPDEMTVDPNSASEVCTYSDAVAASCPSGAAIGFAETVVQVDRTYFSFTGEIYIVEAATVGELNRIAVVFDPTLGALDFGSRIVAIGQGVARTSPAGVDFVFSSLPKAVLDVPKATPMAFRMRSLALQFYQSPDGIDNQFTNPTICATRSFDLALETYTNNSATATDPFTVSGCTQPPPVVDITSPAAGSVTNDSSPAIVFTVSDPAADCELDVDSGTPAPVTSGDTLTALADGVHSLHVNCTNLAGGGSDTNSFRVDTNAPTVVISSPASGSTITDSTPSLDFGVSDLGDPSPSCDMTDGSTLGPYSPGAHSVTVICTDEAGNAGTATNNFTVVAPGFSPAMSASISGRGGAAAAPGAAAALSLGLTTASGDDGVTAFTADLPQVLGISLDNIPNALCESSQASAGACPEAARVGSATATSAGGALSGAVYLLRGASASAPDLAVVFAGQANWLRASRTNRPDGRMRLSFAGQPGALPLKSLNLAIDGFFTLSNSACGPVDLSLPGSATSEGGASVSLNSQVSVQGGGLPAACAGAFTVKSSFKNKARRSTFALKVTAPSGQKLSKLSLTLPNGLKQVKKALKTKLVVKADGRRLAAKCFKFRSATKLDVGLCGKPASSVELSYKSGALTAAKKIKPTNAFSLLLTPDSGKQQSVKTALATR